MDPDALLDRAACGLMQTSDDGTFRRANRVFCDWLGYTREELVGQRRLSDVMTMGGKIFHQTHWAPLLRMQGSLSEVKLELVHRSGSTIPMVLNAIRREEDGVLVHELAAYIARDRDRYEQELVLSRKRLEALVAETENLHALERDRALFAEQMIGIVSHDLRSPLSAIGMAADLMTDADAMERARLIARIDRAVDRASRLITDLLDFTQARVGSGLAVSFGEVNLHAAVAEIVDELRTASPNRTLVHTRRGSGGCWVDASRIGQLLVNLVANAIAYGRPDTPIEIVSSVDDRTCSIAVTNQGEPIAPELVPSLFQPMTRGKTGSSKARSVGLGLFIVQEIAKAHDGSASVRSSATEGTTFTVTIPRSRP